VSNQPQLPLASGRVASLTETRLQAMIHGYYAARGLDESGCADPADLDDLLLGQ